MNRDYVKSKLQEPPAARPALSRSGRHAWPARRVAVRCCERRPSSSPRGHAPRGGQAGRDAWCAAGGALATCPAATGTRASWRWRSTPRPASWPAPSSPITGTLDQLPGLLVLVPAAIGLRGNVFSALGSRLSTAIHVGTFRFSARPDSVLGQNVAASMVLTLARVAAAGDGRQGARRGPRPRPPPAPLARPGPGRHPRWRAGLAGGAGGHPAADAGARSASAGTSTTWWPRSCRPWATCSRSPRCGWRPSWSASGRCRPRSTVLLMRGHRRPRCG